MSYANTVGRFGGQRASPFVHTCADLQSFLNVFYQVSSSVLLSYDMFLSSH